VGEVARRAVAPAGADEDVDQDRDADRAAELVGDVDQSGSRTGLLGFMWRPAFAALRAPASAS
jgi:hypothetical protein